jgi:pimeloyl-ACP methyl ester carboxylesterase
VRSFWKAENEVHVADRAHTLDYPTPSVGALMEILAGGLRTHYTDAGDGDPVLLLHGSGPGSTGGESWAITMPWLASAGFRVVVPDVIGFGQSEKPASYDYAADTWASSIRDLMDALAIDRAHVVGASMGGRIGLTLAARFPQRVRTLTLLGARGVDDGRTLGNMQAMRSYEPSLDAMRAVLHRFVVDPSRITDEMVRTRYESSIAPGVQESYRRMFASNRANLLPLTEDEVRAVAAPTLVLHGREDAIVPVSYAHQLAGLIPDVTAVVIGQCGHWIEMDRPEVVRAQLGFFLGTHCAK